MASGQGKSAVGRSWLSGGFSTKVSLKGFQKMTFIELLTVKDNSGNWTQTLQETMHKELLLLFTLPKMQANRDDF
jgi:hypothetical protein